MVCVQSAKHRIHLDASQPFDGPQLSSQPLSITCAVCAHAKSLLIQSCSEDNGILGGSSCADICHTEAAAAYLLVC